MEASTQPQPAIPSKVFPDQPTIMEPSDMPTEELKKKRNLPFIISLVLFFLVISVLLVLFFLTTRQPSSNNIPVVSAPVIQTSTTPETTGGSSLLGTTFNTTYEARLFNLGFDYSESLKTDTTMRITHSTGATRCFEETASGSGIALNIFKGDITCDGITSELPDGESFELTSKDGKIFNFTAKQDTDLNVYFATGSYTTTSPDNYLLKMLFEGVSFQDVKDRATSVLKTLTFNTDRLKTELTDDIVTSEQ